MTHISRVRLGTFPGTAALFRARSGTDHSQFRSLGLMPMLALTLCLLITLSLVASKPAGAQQQQYQQQLSAVAADWNSVYPAHKTAKGLINAEGIYVVLRGDTLYGIAKRFRVGERTLIQLNGLGEAGRIVTGQTLHVPLRSADAGMDVQAARHVAVAVQAPLATDPAALRQHVVQRGETAYRIATKYGIRLDDLATANGLDASYAVRLGQVLRIPTAPPMSTVLTPSTEVASNSAAVAAAGALTVTAPTFGQAPGFVPPVPSPRPPAPANEPLRLTDAGGGAAAPVPVPALVPTVPEDEGSVTRVHLSGVRTFAPLPAVRREETVLLPERVSSDGANVFNWPVRGRLLSTFGPREGGFVNDGINIAARKGEQVTTSLPGVVIFASDELEKFGNLVLVQHDAEWVSA
ncbi:MAG: LysM peptidoglycan-binding domain-containing protein, partial [Pseudomonadota bacterium]|nr:LysM peptidoglycan-binding domain-containing protein [Pseudomonadota bacterium]